MVPMLWYVIREVGAVGPSDVVCGAGHGGCNVTGWAGLSVMMGECCHCDIVVCCVSVSLFYIF